MTVTATLSHAELTVAAGAETTTELTIANGGEVVDQLTVELLGDAVDWCEISPATVNLMPGTDGPVTLTFTPPRGAGVPAGPVSFGVRVRSREHPGSSTVAEGQVEVGGFTELVGELVPPRRHARRRARYRLAVENTGNRPETVDVSAFDTGGDVLDLRVTPATVVAQPGTVTIVRVSAKARRRFLRGEPRSHPFELELATAGDHLPEPVVVDGVVVQEQVLPRWLLPVFLALVAGAAALAALWFTVLKPTVQSVAAAQVAPAVSEANAAVSQAKEAAAQADQAADVATGAAPGDPATPPTTTTPPGGPEPVDFRVAAQAAPVTDGSYQRFLYTAPDRRPMEIGDLVLQNPRGDSGFLRVLLGDTVVLEAGLANFRDLDYHYVNALRVAGGEAVVVEVNCTAPGLAATRCTPSVSFSGKLLR
jgi:hypothetical protein